MKNMCWLFHEWEKWSKVIEENWVSARTYMGLSIGENKEFVRKCQRRICKECGKIQFRYLS